MNGAGHMAQSMTAASVARSNSAITIFAEEGKKMTKKAAKASVDVEQVEDTEIAALDARIEESTPDEQPVPEQEYVTKANTGEKYDDRTEEQPEPEQKPLTITQKRAALKAAGMKECNRHLKYFDRLPEEAKVAVDGYPVEVRPLSEFAAWGPPCCKPCYKLYDAEWRASRGMVPATPRQGKKEATLEKLIAQRDALNVRIDALIAQQAQQNGERSGGDDAHV
jgi:hypothetical protein